MPDRSLSTALRPALRPAASLLAGLLLLCLLPAPAAGAAERPTLVGQVTDEESQPVAGARVEILRPEGWWQEAGRELDGGEREAVARTTSDEAGRYRVELPEPGFFEIRVATEGRVHYAFEVGPVEGVEVVGDAILTPAETVTVVVVDGDGAPVAGARVAVAGDGGDRVSRRGPFPAVMDHSDRQLAHTGDDGTARFERREGETLAVTVLAPGYAPERLKEAEGTRLTVALEAGETLPVEVRDADGEAVAGAVVGVGSPAVAAGRTAQDGRLALTHDPEVETRVVAYAEDGGRATELVAARAADADGEAADTGGDPDPPLILTLPPRATLTGRTLARGERQPVAGAWVWVNPLSHQAARSDSRGNFTLSTPSRDGRAYLRADAVGYAPSAEMLRPAQTTGNETVTLLLAPTLSASGRVVDGAGQPVAGAEVWSEPADGRLPTPTPGDESFTDAEGRFHLAELVADSRHTLNARHDDFAPGRLDLGPAPAGTLVEGLEITLEPASVAFGRVVDVDESAVPGAEVTLTPGLEGSDISALFRMARGGVTPHSTTTDREGYFEIGGLGDGRFNLAAGAAGFAPLNVPGVELPAGGGRVDLGTLFLEPGLRLEGRVVGSGGEPVADARVGASDDSAFGVPNLAGVDAEGKETRTGADGRFVLDDLARGARLTVWADAEGYARASLEGVEVPTEGPLSIVLEPSATLSGVVTDSSGAPIEGARLVVRGKLGFGGFPGGAFASDRSDEDGHFSIEDVAPGSLVLSAMAEGFLRQERTGLEVVAGETMDDLRVILEPGATVTGRVLDALGNPLSDARVSIVRDRMDFSISGGASASTDADGVYRMPGVPPGERSLEAEHDGHQRQVRDLTVVVGENRLDFRLQAGASVSGRVVDEGGAPVAGALVSASAAGSGPTFRADGETTDDAGAFQLEGLSPGSYNVTARMEGYAATTLEEPVEITGGPVQGVEVVLSRGAVVTGRLLGAELEELAGASVIAGNFNRQDRMPLVGAVDYEGRFRIEGVPAGEWTLMALLADGLPAAQERFTVAPGQREASVDIDLGAAKASLRGRIRLGGEPLASAFVTLAGQDTPARGFGRTDHQGRFEIRGLEDGTYEMEVVGPDVSRRQRRTVEVRGDTEVDVDVEVSTVSGVVIAGGEPVEGARVEIELTDGSPDFRLPTRTGPAGRFRLTGVTAGSYRLRASAQGYAPGEATVTVEEGTPLAGVEIRLQQAGGLELVVLGPFGAPPERLHVAAMEPASATVPGTAGELPLNGGPPTVYTARPPVGEEGRVRLDGLPQGSWDLLVDDGRSAVARRRVTSPGPPVVIALERGHQLTVRVPDLADLGQVGRVELTGADGRPFIDLGWTGTQSNWALSGGSAQVGNLPAGRWTVTASTPDGRTWTGSVVTAGGAAAELVLE